MRLPCLFAGIALVFLAATAGAQDDRRAAAKVYSSIKADLSRAESAREKLAIIDRRIAEVEGTRYEKTLQGQRRKFQSLADREAKVEQEETLRDDYDDLMERIDGEETAAGKLRTLRNAAPRFEDSRFKKSIAGMMKKFESLADRERERKAGIMEKERAREKGRRKKVRAATEAEPGEEDLTEKLRMSDEERDRQARIRKAEVSLPPDLPLDYEWSLPFDRAVGRGSIWVCRDIILAVDGTVLYCYRKRDGVPLWGIVIGDRPQYPPTVSRAMVYVLAGSRLIGISRRIGEIIWRIDPPFSPSAAPCVSEPRLYMPSWDNKVYALEITSSQRTYVGTLKDTAYELRERWRTTTEGHVLNAPALTEGLLYFGGEGGYLYSVSVDGEDRFKKQTQGPILGPVTAKGSGVYAGSSDFTAYAYDRFSGAVRWQFHTGGNIVQPIYPDTSAGVAMVTSEGRGVYGVFDLMRPGRGSEVWHIPDAEYIAGVSPDLVYLVLMDKRLAAVEKKTGTVRWISLLEGIRDVIPNQNDWRRSDDRMRLVCLTESGHIVCLKEPKEELRRTLKRR